MEAKEGHRLAVVEVGDKFLAIPDTLPVDDPADRLRDGLVAAGITLEDMLAAMRERREADDAL